VACPLGSWSCLRSSEADEIDRNELVLEFDGFVETARIASYDLQKFNSHVGRVSLPWIFSFEW
jgi:hypothetical protein